MAPCKTCRQLACNCCFWLSTATLHDSHSHEGLAAEQQGSGARCLRIHPCDKARSPAQQWGGNDLPQHTLTQQQPVPAQGTTAQYSAELHVKYMVPIAGIADMMMHMSAAAYERAYERCCVAHAKS
jgi:hypothetical protein